jgi:ubiquinone/menaquinone biosynthesis C-methylase UbiE
LTRFKAEFDDFASDYDGGADGPIKRFLGNETAFLEWKVIWLVKYLNQQQKASDRLRILDLGCGTGAMLGLWRVRRPQDILCGSDLSQNMLHEARRRWQNGPMPDFQVFRPGECDWPPQSFDVVIISGVLHHIDPNERNEFLRQAAQLLKPDGQACVFEHNPRNFLVRYVVRNTKIDQNAVLLRAEETICRLQTAGFSNTRTSFILFFPPILKKIAILERPLASIPYGGQYAVIAQLTKSSSNAG